MNDRSTEPSGTQSNPIRVVFGLTFLVLFANGFLTYYRLELLEVFRQEFFLSKVQWGIVAFGPPLVEPVLLFCGLFAFGTQIDVERYYLAIVSALVIACALGYFLGLGVGWIIWPQPGIPTPHGVYPVSIMRSVHPSAVSLWVDAVGPVVRAVLTSAAALGVAESY